LPSHCLTMPLASLVLRTGIINQCSGNARALRAVRAAAAAGPPMIRALCSRAVSNRYAKLPASGVSGCAFAPGSDDCIAGRAVPIGAVVQCRAPELGVHWAPGRLQPERMRPAVLKPRWLLGDARCDGLEFQLIGSQAPLPRRPTEVTRLVSGRRRRVPPVALNHFGGASFLVVTAFPADGREEAAPCIRCEVTDSPIARSGLEVPSCS
jgi:hypothetical protein